MAFCVCLVLFYQSWVRARFDAFICMDRSLGFANHRSTFHAYVLSKPFGLDFARGPSAFLSVLQYYRTLLLSILLFGSGLHGPLVCTPHWVFRRTKTPGLGLVLIFIFANFRPDQ